MTYQAPISRPAGAEDFDFLVGEWTIRNSRLNARLEGIDAANPDNWTTFQTDYRMWPLVGGLANADSTVGMFGGEYFEGVSFRQFEEGVTKDGKTEPGLWRIWWADTSNPRLTEQVTGHFADTPEGRAAEFIGEEMFKGRMVRLRFRWIDTGTKNGLATARWDQAYQYEDEHEKAGTLAGDWEVNWIMEFTRGE